jgi:hypothetical protein
MRAEGEDQISVYGQAIFSLREPVRSKPSKAAYIRGDAVPRTYNLFEKLNISSQTDAEQNDASTINGDVYRRRILD